MTSVTASEDELARLRAENHRLSEQVKRLVRAERRMIESQDRLDEQVKLYRQLNEIGKRFSKFFSIDEILHETVQFIIYERNFERCLILQNHAEQFCLIQHEGYYEKDEIFALSLNWRHPAFQAFTGEVLVATIESADPAIRDLSDRIGMDEFVGFAIGEAKVPAFLVLIGNTHERAKYHQRIETDDTILGLTHLIQTVQSAISQKNLYTQIRDRAEVLEQTLQELQQTQMQLIQSEKMSSLGQLVAGVAHEINNPVSFIYGNIAHAREYTSDLIDLLKLYQEISPIPNAAIQDKTKEIDFEFLLEDLPRLLNSMQIGADRIKEIVVSLKTFSRMDEAGYKAVDIHAGIESTLMILQHRLKATSTQQAIAIFKDYGDLPFVECFAGQLNQVFMNLLSNAIDALEDHCETDPDFVPQIKIRTALANANTVSIHILDNGTGISESIQARLFDPFFTTKPVGKGTGMGLSISHQIVTERHQGTLRCISKLGYGTEFIITIPIRTILD